MAKGVDKTTAELRKLLEDKKLVIGKDVTLKQLREGKLQRVLLSANCAQDTRESFERYCTMSKVECVIMTQVDEELGIMCKKPFSISVIGILK